MMYKLQELKNNVLNAECAYTVANVAYDLAHDNILEAWNEVNVTHCRALVVADGVYDIALEALQVAQKELDDYTKKVKK
jgi:hypothetical protein